MLDYMMEPAGITYEDFCEQRILYPSKSYLEGNEETYFKTPSGKAEIYSRQMEQLGLNPVPRYKDVARYRFDESEFKDFPLYLTNAKETAYMLSGYRNVKRIRKRRSEAVAQIHPDLAIKHDIEDGDTMRRDQPTLWAKYGVPNALNVADYLIARAIQFFAPGTPQLLNRSFGVVDPGRFEIAERGDSRILAMLLDRI